MTTLILSWSAGSIKRFWSWPWLMNTCIHYSHGFGQTTEIPNIPNLTFNLSIIKPLYRTGMPKTFPVIWKQILNKTNTYVCNITVLHLLSSKQFLLLPSHGRCSRLVERRGDRLFHTKSLVPSYYVASIQIPRVSRPIAGQGWIFGLFRPYANYGFMVV